MLEISALKTVEVTEDMEEYVKNQEDKEEKVQKEDANQIEN